MKNGIMRIYIIEANPGASDNCLNLLAYGLLATHRAAALLLLRSSVSMVGSLRQPFTIKRLVRIGARAQPRNQMNVLVLRLPSIHNRSVSLSISAENVPPF